MANAMLKQKKTVYVVTFSWGSEYESDVKHVGVKNITVNVTDASNKFDALKAAFDVIAPIVNNVEPARMDVRSHDVCS